MSQNKEEEEEEEEISPTSISSKIIIFNQNHFVNALSSARHESKAETSLLVYMQACKYVCMSKEVYVCVLCVCRYAIICVYVYTKPMQISVLMCVQVLCQRTNLGVSFSSGAIYLVF